MDTLVKSRLKIADLPMSLPHPGPELVETVRSHATRLETRWEDRRTVWHGWGEGEPLVLLHGGSGSWTHWIHNVLPLAASGRQVLAADMPGCGDSDPPATGGDADALVEPLAAGLRDLLGARAFDLVGFSFGGLVAGLMAAQVPGAIRRLVLVGAPVLPLAGRPVRLLDWRHLPESEQRDVHRANLQAMMLHHGASITDLAIDVHAANVARDRLRRRRLSRTDALARALQQVHCPLAALYGRHDVLYRDRLREIEATLDALPVLQSRTAIDAAGHWVQFEAPDAFNTALSRTLDAMPSAWPL